MNAPVTPLGIATSLPHEPAPEPHGNDLLAPSWSQRIVRQATASVARLQWAGGRVGAYALAGLLLMLAAAFVLFARVLPAGSQLSQLQDQLQKIPAAGAAAAAAGAGNSARDLLSRLPRRADLPAVVATMITQADAAQLELPTGNYEYNVPKVAGAARYQIVLPVRGSYVAIRRFVDGSLAAIPAAALESIRLQRDDVGSAELVAELKFVIYVRSGS